MKTVLDRPRNHVKQSALGRTRQIARVLVGHGLESLAEPLGLGRFVPRRIGLERHAEPHRTQAERMRLAMGELGAAFIKLGQMLSMRGDILPPEYIAEFTKLQDSAPAVPFEQIEAVLREELGSLPQPVFATFARAPIASASIGQVHAAVLPDGTPVVVKVRRPGVAAQVELDLGILRRIVDWVQAHTPIGRDYDLKPIVDEFAYTIRDEMDYVLEGRNATRLRRAFEGDRGVWIPRVFEGFTTRRVLTMERVGGVKITDLETLDRIGISRRAVAENAVRLFLREVFEFGFFHGDPHAGNFFVQPDASLAIVDFGMVGRLSESTHRHLMQAMIAASREDAEDLADALYSLGVAGPRASRVPFERDLAHMIARFSGCSIGELSAKTMTEDLSRMAFRHRLQLPGELALLLRVINIGEGLGLMLDPDFRYLEYASPIIRRSWKKRMSPSELAKRAGRAALDAAELGADLPKRISRLVGRMERGEAKITMEHHGLEEVTREFQKMTNRLALSVILAASVVALALAAAFHLSPAVESMAIWLFRIALVFSLVFGATVLWGIWRARKG